MPFCNTPKNSQPSSSTSNNYVFIFCANYVGFFGLCFGQKFFHRENKKAKKEPSHLPSLSLSLPPSLYFLSHWLSYLSLYYLSLFFFLYIQTPFLYCLFTYLSYSSLSPHTHFLLSSLPLSLFTHTQFLH